MPNLTVLSFRIYIISTLRICVQRTHNFDDAASPECCVVLENLLLSPGVIEELISVLVVSFK